MTLQNYFSHPSLVIYFLATPSIKLKLGQRKGERLLIANHLDQSLWCANHEPWAVVVVRSYLLHSFLQVRRVVAPFLLATAMCTIMRSQNHFLEPNRHTLDFLHPILLCTITYEAPLEMAFHNKRSRLWNILGWFKRFYVGKDLFTGLFQGLYAILRTAQGWENDKPRTLFGQPKELV